MLIVIVENNGLLMTTQSPIFKNAIFIKSSKLVTPIRLPCLLYRREKRERKADLLFRLVVILDTIISHSYLQMVVYSIPMLRPMKSFPFNERLMQFKNTTVFICLVLIMMIRFPLAGLKNLY